VTEIIDGHMSGIEVDEVLKVVFYRYGPPSDGHCIVLKRGDGTPYFTDGNIVIWGFSTPKCSGSKIHATGMMTAPESYGVFSPI